VRTLQFILGPITGGLIKNTELPMLIIPKGYVFKPINNILLGLKSGVIRHSHVLDPLHNLLSVFKS